MEKADVNELLSNGVGATKTQSSWHMLKELMQGQLTDRCICGVGG